MTLVLASRSASRQAMLAAAGVAFEARPAAIDERAAEAAVVSIRPEELEPFVSRAAAAPGRDETPAPPRAGPTASGSWILPNQMGLHARPAATLSTGLTDLDAEVTVNGVDGKSVMLLMSLGLGQGRTVTVEASGPDAQAAVDLVGQAVESGFGEPT